MSSCDFRDTLHVRYTRDGVTGHGEGAPIVRYNESAESARKSRRKRARPLLGADPAQFAKIMAAGFQALDSRTRPASGHRYRADGLDRPETGRAALPLLWSGSADAPVTTFSIGIDDPETTRAKVEEAAPFPGAENQGRPRHRRSHHRGRSRVTKKPLRVDANEGWKDKEEAVRKINWLENAGRRVHRTAHARRHDRGDALGAQPRTHADHRRRSLPPCRGHSEAAGRFRRRQRQAG